MSAVRHPCSASPPTRCGWRIIAVSAVCEASPTSRRRHRGHDCAHRTPP
jgi:hypothetical protein